MRTAAPALTSTQAQPSANTSSSTTAPAWLSLNNQHRQQRQNLSGRHARRTVHPRRSQAGGQKAPSDHRGRRHDLFQRLRSGRQHDHRPRLDHRRLGIYHVLYSAVLRVSMKTPELTVDDFGEKVRSIRRKQVNTDLISQKNHHFSAVVCLASILLDNLNTNHIGRAGNANRYTGGDNCEVAGLHQTLILRGFQCRIKQIKHIVGLAEQNRCDAPCQIELIPNLLGLGCSR